MSILVLAFNLIRLFRTVYAHGTFDRSAARIFRTTGILPLLVAVGVVILGVVLIEPFPDLSFLIPVVVCLAVSSGVTWSTQRSITAVRASRVRTSA